MFNGDLGKRAVKGAIPAEPFIDDDAKGVLIASRAGMRLHLFWGHVGNGSGGVLLTALLHRAVTHIRATTRVAGPEGLVSDCDAEVAEQNLVIASQPHVLPLDVAMDHVLVMCILQGASDSLDAGDLSMYWEPRALRVTLAQRATPLVLHNSNRR